MRRRSQQKVQCEAEKKIKVHWIDQQVYHKKTNFVCCLQKVVLWGRTTALLKICLCGQLFVRVETSRSHLAWSTDDRNFTDFLVIKTNLPKFCPKCDLGLTPLWLCRWLHCWRTIFFSESDKDPIRKASYDWDAEGSFTILDLPSTHLKTTFIIWLMRIILTPIIITSVIVLTLASILMWCALVLIVQKKVHVFWPKVKTVIGICKRYNLDNTSLYYLWQAVKHMHGEASLCAVTFHTVSPFTNTVTTGDNQINGFYCLCLGTFNSKTKGDLALILM